MELKHGVKGLSILYIVPRARRVALTPNSGYALSILYIGFGESYIDEQRINVIYFQFFTLDSDGTYWRRLAADSSSLSILYIGFLHRRNPLPTLPLRLLSILYIGF